MGIETALFGSMLILAIMFAMIPYMRLKRYSLRATASLAALLLLSSLTFGIFSVSGTPYRVHQVDFLQRQTGSLILDFVIVRDKAIYYWLMPKGETEPFYLRRPYNDKEAQRLRRAKEEAMIRGNELYFEPDFGVEPERWVIPKEPAVPPKGRVHEGRKFEHPEYGI